MILYCHKCKTPLTIFDNFCRKCGEDAPRLTIPPDAQEPALTEYVHCAHCAAKNHKDALYCAACGKGIYSAPGGACFCPQCGRKNPAGSRFCTGCTLSLSDWFAMKSAVAQRLGLTGNVTFIERMTGITFSFFTEGAVTIGRSDQNTVTVPCLWLSSRHCTVDPDKGVLADNKSTNGTFVNRKPDRVLSVPFSRIEELNLGSALTFKAVQCSGLLAIRLSAVLKDAACGTCTNENACEVLRKRYLVFGRSGEVHIRKSDGEVVPAVAVAEPCCTIAVADGAYFLTDTGKSMRRQLLLKDGANMPENWKIVT